MNPETENRREFINFAIILAAAVLLFWWRVWIPAEADRMHFTDDILIKDYPTRLGLFRLFLAGHLPLWDPYQFGGWPGIANCEAGFFYPLNWVLIPFVYTPDIAFQVTQWLVLLHFWIAGLGAYRLARAMGQSPIGASLAAVAFTFCGFHCAHKKHTNMFFALVWLPWIFLQAEIWIRERRPWTLLGLIFFLALAYLAGHPQASLYITLVLAARMIHAALASIPPEDKTLPRMIQRSLPVFLVVGVAFLLTAIQWLPLLELIQQGERSTADVFRRSTEYSLPPFELLDAFFPEALQNWSQVEVFYWGGIPLLLMFLALLKSSLDSFYRFLLLLGAFAILLSLGGYLFVYDLSYVLVPGVAWVRAPSRWIYFAGLPIALLAGRGIDLLVRNHSELSREEDLTFSRMGLGWFGLLGLLMLCIMPNVDQEMRLNLVRGLIYQVLFSGSFLIGLLLYQYKRVSPQGIALLAIGLTWLDLGTQYRMLDLAPGPGGYVLNKNVQQIQNYAWSQRTKVFLQSGGIRDQYHGAAQGFQELDGQSPLTPLIHLDLRKDTAIPFPNTPNTALLNLLGVGTVLTDHLTLAYPFTDEGDQLFVNQSPLHRARVYQDIFTATPMTQRSLLALQSFPFNRVLLMAEKENVQLSDTENESEEMTIDLPPEKILLDKPFLLASCSIQAATPPSVLLVMDGINHFEDLGDDPGYYFAVVDPQSIEVEDTACFNLQSGIYDPEHPEHQRMREFVDAIPPGKIVFAAVRDNAANSLLAEGLSALRAIGAAADVRNGFRHAHAVVGRKGAPLGSALEIFSPTEALVLQTTQSLTVEGVVTGKPQAEYLATTTQAEEWFELFEQVDEITPRPISWAEDNPSGNQSLFPNLPILIYSVPKKSGMNPVLQPSEDRSCIIVNGQDLSPNRVGYNLIVMDPDTRRVVARDSFDLFKDYDENNPENKYVADPPLENLRMQDFIHSVTEGHIVMGAIRDDGTDLIQPDTIETLRLIGSDIIIDTTEPKNRKRISHAFIGIKGSTECIEAYGQEQNAIVFTRYPGGPVLMREDLTNPSDLLQSVNPMNEIIKSASDTTWNEPGPEAVIWSVEDQGPNCVVATGLTDNGGMLFLNEIFYPGWRSRIDGLPQPIHRANYYFRAVLIPRGQHRVVMEYQPDMFHAGLYLSLAGLMAFIGWVVWIRWQPKR